MRIRELRDARGYTTAQAAVRAGLDPAAWNRVEKGHASPNLRTLRKMAAALEVPVTELLEEPAPKGQAPLFEEPTPAAVRVDDRLEDAGHVAAILAERWRALAREIPSYGTGAGPLALQVGAMVAAQAGDTYRRLYRDRLGPAISRLPEADKAARLDLANRQLEMLGEAAALVGEAARALAGEDRQRYGAPEMQLKAG